MRKLIINNRSKLGNVESYIKAVHSLMKRQLPIYKDLPKELLDDDNLEVSVALRDNNYNGPIITKDELKFINETLDNSAYVVHRQGGIALPEWLALTNDRISLSNIGRDCTCVEVSSELIALNCPEKWKPLCTHSLHVSAEHTLPTKIKVIDDMYGQNDYTTILPLMGANSKQVATTVIVRDIASLLAKGPAFDLTYTFILDDRNSLSIPISDTAHDIEHTKGTLESFIFSIMEVLCVDNPIASVRGISMECLSCEIKTFESGQHLMMAKYTLSVTCTKEKIRAPWELFEISKPASTYRSESITSGTPNGAVARVLTANELRQCIRIGKASISQELRLFPVSLMLADRLGVYFMRMWQNTPREGTDSRISTAYKSLEALLLEVNSDDLRQQEGAPLARELWEKLVQVV